MTRITSCSSWGRFDQLDDIFLRPNERLRIRFPDGREEVHHIRIDESREVGSAYGQPTSVPNRRAFIETTDEGVLVRVYLVGMAAERCP